MAFHFLAIGQLYPIDTSDTLLIHYFIMPTTKKRINISLSSDMEKALETLARRDDVPEATKAAELLRIALETEDDQVWDVLASDRDRKGAKFVPHKKAWT